MNVCSVTLISLIRSFNPIKKFLISTKVYTIFILDEKIRIENNNQRRNIKHIRKFYGRLGE